MTQIHEWATAGSYQIIFLSREGDVLTNVLMFLCERVIFFIELETVRVRFYIV